ncbi:hypothetical protein L2737_15890 [Shewanella electrodiphila]|uniref:Uncharacterized protein n=1 Tax=Shewanella electrodiphila TaxID=934143 RepID=A0ABT0KSG2_9GAMM|nr:hypothetical protein [Shewanella electrodiphila]MCL1046791.1 hypothetical protein [Shewanella electrodiphila]
MTKHKLILKLPFVCFVFMSIAWWYFYTHDMWLNDFGRVKSEWLLLIDMMVTMPLICFVCVKSNKLALLKSLSYFALFVALGSYVIPAENQVLWLHLTDLRYVLITGFFIIELSAILCVILAIRQAVKSGEDPDIAIDNSIINLVGNGILASVLMLETRVWSFVFCSRFIKPSSYKGEQHFYYHHKDANQSNSLGFMLMIAFEIPLMHLLIHFIWSPFAANIITGLTCFSLAFFIAEYRAMSRRPISIDQQTLYVRYGVFNQFTISLSNITSIHINHDVIARSEHIKRYNFSGVPNVRILLTHPVNGIDAIYLGVNEPHKFIKAISLINL